MTEVQVDYLSKGAQKAPFGILLVNLGSPDAPTPKAVRQYLAEFLSDSRVVSIPKWIWLPILHGIILRIRPKKVAHAYQLIWRNESPLIEITREQARALQEKLSQDLGKEIPVFVGMRYGNPSLSKGLLQLRAANVARVLVLPLYPQFSTSTTATVFDKIGALFRKCWHIPELRYVPAYFNEKSYINALANRVTSHWREKGRASHLVISFHGLPTRFSKMGDPYEAQCKVTAQLLATALNLNDGEWSLAFQSRFGKEEWLQPYLEPHVQALAQKGVKCIDVVCPGFSSDCLETLEEIAVRTQEAFQSAGGEKLNYIEALNDADDHITMMAELVQQNVRGWS